VGKNRTLIWVVVLGLVAAAGIGGSRLFQPAKPPPGVTLTDLHDVGQLRSMFNGSRGTARLVVIFSPT